MIISFNDYRKVISPNIYSNEFWLYRGQDNNSWKLLNSFTRYCLNNDISFEIKNFFEILEEFIDNSSDYFNRDTSNLELLQKMALAQHHGLPTPLLDWTDSPFIAVFFAICNRDIKNKKPFRIWSMRIDKKSDYFLQHISNKELLKDFHIIHTKVFNSKRIIRQRGYFSYVASSIALEDYIYNNPNNIKLISYDIDGENWLAIIRELYLMGIYHANMFDSLDGVAKDTILNSLKDKEKY